MTFRTVFALAATLLFQSSFLIAQNLNTTFRSKLTYPGQTLANVWGYVANGKEYALVGGSNGMIIVDITNPDVPQQIVQIQSPEGSPNNGSLWKEIKTYQHYAYLVTEAGGGIQIVNLSDLPSPNLFKKLYIGDGAVHGQMASSIHALHIDETKGFLYIWGGGVFGGGAKVFDLKPDPWNPKYVGKFDQLGYVHDGYVDNDTMYSAHIYAGQFAIVNMADKTAPELINTQTTPSAFTHNTWISDDRRTIFATDERDDSYLSAWDVSDPTDIKFLDQIQSNAGSGSMVHNTYVRGNWAITSWYKDGFTIVDITRPANLVQVGNHDTYPGAGGGSEGCWGVYHNFPSGNIIASNINVGGKGELWIVTPNFVRACYLEGKITHGITGDPLQNAQIKIIGTNPLKVEASAPNGVYKMGQEKEGYYQVQVSKAGYQTFETSVYMQRGEVIFLDVPLFPNGLLNLSGTVTRQQDGLPVEGATVWAYGAQNFSSTLTDAAGAYHLDNLSLGTYDVAASAPGMGLDMLPAQTIVSDTTLNLTLYSTFRREGVRQRDALEKTGNLLTINANPFQTETVLQYELPQEGAMLELRNALGQTLQTWSLSGSQGQEVLGSHLPAGTYFAVLTSGGHVLEVKKLIKTP